MLGHRQQIVTAGAAGNSKKGQAFPSASSAISAVVLGLLAAGFLPDQSSGQVSRLLKRQRVHGLIKKVGHTDKYYLTRFGKHVIATGRKLRELVIIPQLAFGRLD